MTDSAQALAEGAHEAHPLAHARRGRGQRHVLLRADRLRRVELVAAAATRVSSRTGERFNYDPPPLPRSELWHPIHDRIVERDGPGEFQELSRRCGMHVDAAYGSARQAIDCALLVALDDGPLDAATRATMLAPFAVLCGSLPHGL